MFLVRLVYLDFCCFCNVYEAFMILLMFSPFLVHFGEFVAVSALSRFLVYFFALFGAF